MIVSNLEGKTGVTPPNHFGMCAFPLIDKGSNSDERLGCSISYYLPGGGVGFDVQRAEMIYYVVDGEMTIETDDGDIALLKGEAIHISKGENKGVKNKSNYPACVLVIGNRPADADQGKEQRS